MGVHHRPAVHHKPAVVHHKPAAVHHRAPVVVHPRPVVVAPVPRMGTALATGMLMGATTGLLIGAMSRNKRNQTKHKDNKIYVYQPFPGTLVAKHKDHHEPPEFFTIATNETVPSDVAVVLRPGQIGTLVQITQEDGSVVQAIFPPNSTNYTKRTTYTTWCNSNSNRTRIWT